MYEKRYNKTQKHFPHSHYYHWECCHQQHGNENERKKKIFVFITKYIFLFLFVVWLISSFMYEIFVFIIEIGDIYNKQIVISPTCVVVIFIYQSFMIWFANCFSTQILFWANFRHVKLGSNFSRRLCGKWGTFFFFCSAKLFLKVCRIWLFRKFEFCELFIFFLFKVSLCRIPPNACNVY